MRALKLSAAAGYLSDGQFLPRKVPEESEPGKLIEREKMP